MLIHDLCLLSILPVHRGSSGYWWMDRGNAEGTYVHKISDTCYYSPVYVDDDDDEIPFQDNRTRRIKCVYPTEYSWEPKPKVFDLEIVWKRFLPHIDVGVYSAVNACPHTNQIIYYG